MAERLTPDICVIGAGAAGLSVAAAAAALGVPVVLVERGKMGGECLNTGCVPSKALLAAARRAEEIRGSGRFGVNANEPVVDFRAVHDHVREVIDAIAPTDSARRFQALGVRVIEGHAAFKDRRTVLVGDAYEIRARRFVIATGSRPAVPPIPGLEKSAYFTNETIFSLTERPRHLIVIGAGSVGLEMAQAFRRLGSAVTVLETAQPLAHDDPEAAGVVLAQLARDGVDVRCGVTIARVAVTIGSARAMIETNGGEETIEGTHLLVAAGRLPNIEGLGLEAARIRHDQAGIVVNRKLKTRNARVYAIGDAVAGQPRFTHVANHHAGLVIRNAVFRLPVNVNKAVIPRVTFTDPELAQTGLTEAQARERRIKVRVLRWPYHDNDRAQTARETHGHIKVVTDKKGKIVGVTIVGAQAGELITAWTLAIAQGLNIRVMTDIVVPYPTLSELGKRAAFEFFTPSLTRPLLRRIIAWLRIFG